MDKRLFTRQFLLTPTLEVPENFSSWPSIQIKDYTLKHHGLLKTYCIREGSKELILLGFAYHCYHPEYEEADMLQALIAQQSDHEFWDELDCFSGNYVLIRIIDDHIQLYNDVATAAKVFYDKSQRPYVVGSDPKIIGTARELVRDPSEEVASYYNSPYFKGSLKYMGDLTYYQNIFQLLSNHYLDLASGEAIRFFPREKRRILNLEKGIKNISHLICNNIQACFQKHPLYVSLTSGWDTRLIMSATKEISKDVTYYTFRRKVNTDSDPDLAVPMKMCRELGLNHVEIHDSGTLPDEELDIIKKSYELVNPYRFSHFYTAFGHEAGDTVALVGTVSEICRNLYEWMPVNNGKAICKAAHMPLYPYCINYFEHWHQKNHEYILDCGYEIQDFSLWEQGICNNSGYVIFYSSYILDAYSIFNCRELIKTILSVDPKYRDKHENFLYKQLIKQLWPELLRYPINPYFKYRMTLYSKKLKLYPAYKKIKHMIS